MVITYSNEIMVAQANPAMGGTGTYDIVGDFLVYYNVQDSAGNHAETQTIHVTISEIIDGDGFAADVATDHFQKTNNEIVVYDWYFFHYLSWGGSFWLLNHLNYNAGDTTGLNIADYPDIFSQYNVIQVSNSIGSVLVKISQPPNINSSMGGDERVRLNHIDPITGIETMDVFPDGFFDDFALYDNDDIWRGQLLEHIPDEFVPFRITLMEGTPQTTSGAFNDDDVDLADIKDIEEW